MKKLYFYTVEYRFLESGECERFLSRKEKEARETAKLYLPAAQVRDDDFPGSPVFPCGLTRLPKERVDTAEVSEGWLILTKPDDEAARAAWRRRYAGIADMCTRQAEENRKQAEECRKIAATL